MGGRLKGFLPQWDITSNEFVLHIIRRSYALDFHIDPPSKFLVTKLPRDSEKARALPLLIGEMVDQDVLMPVPVPEQGDGFYSHMFVIKKPPGKFRL